MQCSAACMEEVADLWYGGPMDRDEAITLLRCHEADLRRLGVERLFLFGSTARGDASAESDVDLFFDYEKGSLGLYELMDLQAEAARILGRRADVTSRDSLHRLLRPGIEASAIRVF